MGIPWINHAELFRKPAGTSAKSDTPCKGQFTCSPWQRHGNRIQGKARPVRALQPARSIPNGGVLLGRPCRACGFKTDQTHGVAMGCE
jgi:hypothetical protein